MAAKDYYDILEVSPTATQEEIKKQYRFVLHAWHPDKFPDPEQKARANEKTKEINEAYEILGDVEKRAQYDRQRSAKTSSTQQPDIQQQAQHSPPKPPQQTRQQSSQTGSGGYRQQTHPRTNQKLPQWEESWQEKREREQREKQEVKHQAKQARNRQLRIRIEIGAIVTILILMYLSRYISWQPANFNMGYVSPTLAPGDLATKTKLSEFRNATDTQKANSTATAFAVNFLPIQAPNLDRVKQQRLSGHGRSVLGVTFSPDSTLLATAGLDGTLRLWDAKTGTSLRVIDGGWELRDVAISPDGHWAAFSSFGSKSLQLMDLQTYEIRHTWFDLSPTTLSFSPDSKLIAFSDRSGNVHIRDIASEKEFATINGGLDVEFNPNGKLLAIASGTQIHLWDASTFQRVAALPNPKYNGSEPKWVSLVFSPNGKFLAATNGPLIGIWDTEKRRIVSTITHETRFFGLAFSPDGTLLAAGRIHDMVSLYSTETGSFIANIGTRQELERVAAVAFSPNGRFLAAGGDGNIITLWSVPAK